MDHYESIRYFVIFLFEEKMIDFPQKIVRIFRLLRLYWLFFLSNL